MQHLATIVVPTYNRPRELARFLELQEALREPCRILVLDGSDANVAAQNQRKCGQFAGVQYRGYPSTLHLGLRLADGLASVQTPYVLFCGDDDVVFRDGIAQCVDFLESHADYAAAIGRVWTLRYFPKLPVIRRGICLGRELDHGDSFGQPRFVQRSLFYFAYTMIGSIPLFYALRRTEQTRRAFALVTDRLKYSSMEAITVCSLLIAGRVAKLPVPFGARDYASVTTRDAEREGATSYIPAEDLQYMRPFLVQALQDAEGLPEAMASYVVDSVLLLWSGDVAQFPAAQDSATVVFLRKVGFCLQCMAASVAPAATAKALGIPRDTYLALLRVHRKFTARRRDSQAP